MKKVLVLMSVFGLAACGGSGGGSGSVVSNNNTHAFRDIEIPDSRVSSAAAISNGYVTGMDNSVTNISKMTAAVEAVLGTDALNSIATNSERISDLINRSSFSRKSTSGALHRGHSDKDRAAYIVLEAGQTFKNWGRDKRQRFFTEQPDIVKYWGKIFCGCNINAYNQNQILDIFDVAENQANWDNFYEQNHYREYTLDNVKFTMAAASGGDESGAKDVLKFHLNPQSGQIDTVEFHSFSSEDGVLKEDSEIVTNIVRNADDERGNVFGATQEFADEKVINARARFLTYGKKQGLGLKYSDFGQILSEQDIIYQDGHQEHEYGYEAFAGGYEELRKELPETAMNFSGKAVGSVSNNHIDKNIAGDATLAFDGHSETLNMYFSDTALSADSIPWYDVKIVRNKFNNSNSITFTTDDELNANIPENFRFNAADFENNVKTPIYHLVNGYSGEGYGHDKIQGHGYGKLDIGYYGGINESVTEATGVTQYVESMGSNGEIRMNVGFGMQKDNH